jgi:K+-transporting ATPase ATPase C chain
MKGHLRAAFVGFLLLTLLTGAVYPALVTLIAQGIFPHRAGGSIIEHGGKRVGSELIGQQFDDERYFWGRPSATTNDAGSLPYNSASSQGSNNGPTNDAFLKEVAAGVERLKQAHPDQTGPVPVDLVTASASGLDPHISPAAAAYQVKRVAKATGLSEGAVRRLVEEHTEGRTFGVLGEPRVNVLTLNLALDAMAKR